MGFIQGVKLYEKIFFETSLVFSFIYYNFIQIIGIKFIEMESSEQFFPERSGMPKRTHKMTKAQLKLAYALSLRGCTMKDMAEVFEVSERTIEYWKKTRPEFLEAVNRGKDYAANKVSKSLFKRANGYTVIETKVVDGTNMKGEPYKYTSRVEKHIPGDVKAMIFWLVNKDRGNWTDTQKIEISDSSLGNVANINTDAMTEEQKRLIKEINIKRLANISGTTSKN